MKSNVVVVIAALCMAAAIWYVAHQPSQVPASNNAQSKSGVGDASKGTPTAPPAVSVTKANLADFIETVLVTGSIVARDEILIAPEIESFRIVGLSAEEGDTVKKGDVLARLSSATLDMQLAQSEANIARAGASIAIARSAIVQAEAAEKEAEQAFDRARPLRQSGTISEATFDQRDSASKTAKARLVSSRDSLKSAEADKAALEAAQREIVWRKERSDIRSPVDGIVSRRTARVGAVATAIGDPLFRIIAKGEVELDAEIAERDLGRVKDGQEALINITGVGEVRGTVRLISSEVERATRIGRARISLGVNPAIKLGAFGRGSVETARSRGIGVPTSAVVFAADGTTVQIVSDGKVNTRAVTTGLATQTLIEIVKGIAEGDTVVAKAGSFLRDGDSVRPIFASTKLSNVAP